jgi:hypothetical protein
LVGITNPPISLLTNNVPNTDPTWADGWLEQNTYFNSTQIIGNYISNSPTYAIVYRGWHCTFMGNTVNNCSSAIFQGGRITATGNEIFNSTSIGIDFGNVTHGVVMGNVISKTDHPAVEVNACADCVITGNILQESLQNYVGGNSYFSSSVWVHDGEGGTVPARVSDNITISNNDFNINPAGKNINCIGVFSPTAKVIVSFNNFSNGRFGATGSDIISASPNLITFGNGNNASFAGNLLETNSSVSSVVIPVDN